jgi:hypothetical protein
MRTWSHPRALAARTLPALAIIVVVSATAGTAASAAGRATGDRLGPIKLLGAPALMDAAGVTDSTKRHYEAAVRVVNSSDEWKDVAVRFDAMKGSKVVLSATAEQTVQPGEGLALAEDMKMEKGLKAVRARIVSVKPASADDVLASFKLRGKPKLVQEVFGGCAWTARVENPGDHDADISNSLFFVAVLRGRIVSAGRALLTFDLKAHKVVTVSESYEPCAKKADAVRGYFQNT